MLIQFVDFSVLLFDFRSVFFDASLRVEERLLDESGIGLLHVWETLDAEVLHDLFDLLLQVEHFGLEFCSLRRFWREREGARVGARVSSSVHYCRRFAGVQWNWKRERGHKRKAEKKRGRTMDTSFVVSAAFCAPVVTESQNDMAVFVAIAVWTEMVAFLVVSKTKEQGHARCFLTTRRAYLSTRPFFALEKKKRNVPLKGMNTKIRVGVDEGGVKYTLRVRLDEE